MIVCYCGHAHALHSKGVGMRPGGTLVVVERCVHIDLFNRRCSCQGYKRRQYFPKRKRGVS